MDMVERNSTSKKKRKRRIILEKLEKNYQFQQLKVLKKKS